MSDLTATNCGCSNNCGNNTFGFGNGCNWIWIILLFSCCGNNNGGFLGGCGNNSCDNGCNNNGCEWIIWILLLSCFCGNNNSGC